MAKNHLCPYNVPSVALCALCLAAIAPIGKPEGHSHDETHTERAGELYFTPPQVALVSAVTSQAINTDSPFFKTFPLK